MCYWDITMRWLTGHSRHSPPSLLLFFYWCVAPRYCLLLVPAPLLPPSPKLQKQSCHKSAMYVPSITPSSTHALACPILITIL